VLHWPSSPASLNFGRNILRARLLEFPPCFILKFRLRRRLIKANYLLDSVHRIPCQLIFNNLFPNQPLHQSHIYNLDNSRLVSQRLTPWSLVLDRDVYLWWESRRDGVFIIISITIKQVYLLDANTQEMLQRPLIISKQPHVEIWALDALLFFSLDWTDNDVITHWLMTSPSRLSLAYVLGPLRFQTFWCAYNPAT
jgi:hypothetical protein